MSGPRRISVAWVVAAVWLAGLVGPCLCGPFALAAASHGCCDDAPGLRPAPLDCCDACSANADSRENALVRGADSPPGLALAVSPERPALPLATAALPPPLRPLSLVVSPPPVLRV